MAGSRHVRWTAALAIAALTTGVGYADADATPPATVITSQQGGGTTLSGDRIFGTVTDDSSGVARVTVTFTPIAPSPDATATTESASMACRVPTSCAWAVPQPLTRGVYEVTAFAEDLAGNVESPGARVTLIDVGPGTVPLGPGVIPDPSDTPIQPGAPIDLHRGPLAGTPAGVCTMNFVFADAQHVYIGTAGHCVLLVGERASAPGLGAFGTVVYAKECWFSPCAPGQSFFDDFALIRVDPDKRGLVSPEVRGFGPIAGYTTAGEGVFGDLVFMHGWGVGFDPTPPTRDRYAILLDPTDEQRYASTLATTSDSGSPAVHIATRKALGVVAVRDENAANITGGPTIERALALLAEAGLDVTLVTGTAAAFHGG